MKCPRCNAEIDESVAGMVNCPKCKLPVNIGNVEKVKEKEVKEEKE